MSIHAAPVYPSAGIQLLPLKPPSDFVLLLSSVLLSSRAHHTPAFTNPQVRYASADIFNSNPEKFAKSRGEYVRSHFKNTREVAAAISGT